MKLFKLSSIFICVICLMLCTIGCMAILKTDFEFLHDSSEIALIEIVEVGELDNTDRMNPKQEFYTICEIQDIEQFLNDFSDVECRDRFTDPKRPLEGTVGIKITYNNGDYEIICYSGQAECVDGTYSFEEGWHYFDVEQFEELLNKYNSTTE